MCLLSLCRLLSINVRLDPFADEMKSEAEKIGVFPGFHSLGRSLGRCTRGGQWSGQEQK